MVKKYVILADSNDKTFNIPRQLMEINGEKLVERTIRLLKENGVKDIIVTAKDKRFDGLDAKIYAPSNSDYDYITGKGYWLNAFPFELMDEPICFIWGDVYFSEKAIKTIVETDTDSTLFFCTYKNDTPLYIKHHDEPLAYKVVDINLFQEHIEKVKRLYDKGKTIRHPIVWELYRSINGQDINVHEMTKNYVAINDESCDIDTKNDIIELKKIVGGNNMIKCETIREFSLEKFDELKNVVRYNPNKKQHGKLYVRDTFECDKETADYLMGNNQKGITVIKVIEVIPEEDVFEKYEEEIIKEEAQEKPKKSKKKKASKK